MGDTRWSGLVPSGGLEICLSCTCSQVKLKINLGLESNSLGRLPETLAFVFVFFLLMLSFYHPLQYVPPARIIWTKQQEQVYGALVAPWALLYSSVA